MSAFPAGPGRDVLPDRPTAAGRVVLLPVGLAAFVATLDSTVVTVAAPSLRTDLGLGLSGLQWVSITYLLAFGGLMLVGGRLTDLLGRRRVMTSGLVLFGAASVLVAMAPGLGLLLTGRCLQGVAAALMLPAAFAFVAADLEEKDRHLGAAVAAGAIGAALALGPAVGGVITQFLHWSFVFWINLPLVAVTLLLVVRVVPLHPPSRAGWRQWLARLDLPGMTFSSLTLLGLTFALVEGQSLGWDSPWVLGSAALVVVAGAPTVLAEARSPYPVLDPELLGHRLIVGSFAAQLLWGLGINGVVFFTSLFLQDVLALSPTTAGLVFVPLALAVGASVPFVGRLTRLFGAHRVVAAGMVVVAGGLLGICTVGPGDSVWQVVPAVLVIGIGSALTIPMSSAPLDVVPVSRAGVVSALLSVSREVAGVLGLAVTGAVVAARQSAALATGQTQLDGFLSGYRAGLVVGAALALVAAVVALRTLEPGQAMLPEQLEEPEQIDEREHLDELDVVIDLRSGRPGARQVGSGRSAAGVNRAIRHPVPAHDGS